MSNMSNMSNLEVARGIIMMVIDDLTSRKGFDLFWDNINDNIKSDIITKLEQIAKNYIDDIREE